MPATQTEVTPSQRRLRFLVVNAFTTGQPLTTGNPAAVVLLPPHEDELADEVMQQIAAQMNLSETAFVRWTDTSMRNLAIRWFTPRYEVDLCGHATLAAAAAVHAAESAAPKTLRFTTLRAGALAVRSVGAGALLMDFPVCRPHADVDEEKRRAVLAALGLDDETTVVAVRQTTFDVIVEVGAEANVASISPNFAALAAVDTRGVAVCARAEGDTAFVARFFAPGHGIDEDPVTGSMMCALAPLFLEDGAPARVAWQLSSRGGRVEVAWLGERVELSGSTSVIADGHLLV